MTPILDKKQKNKSVSVRIPQDLLAKLDEEVRSTGYSRSMVIVLILRRTFGTDETITKRRKY